MVKQRGDVRATGTDFTPDQKVPPARSLFIRRVQSLRYSKGEY